MDKIHFSPAYRRPGNKWIVKLSRATSKAVRIAGSHIITTCATAAALLLFAISAEAVRAFLSIGGEDEASGEAAGVRGRACRGW